MAIDMAEWGFDASAMTPPDVSGAVAEWLVNSPGAAPLNGQTIDGQETLPGPQPAARLAGRLLKSSHVTSCCFVHRCPGGPVGANKRFISIAGAGRVLAAVLAGCSSGGSGTPASGAPSASGDYVIGVDDVLSGPLASYGQ